MKKSDMTIGRRLAIGFGAVFLLMIGLTAMAVSRVDSIDTSLNRINDVNNVKQRYAINFRAACTTARSPCATWRWPPTPAPPRSTST